MVKRILDRFSKPQESILSAAGIVMVMVVASRILGLVRQRTLAHFFAPESLSLYFAAFRLPDTIFEVLIFGTFSSAFIPVFTSYIKKDVLSKEAWEVASLTLNVLFVFFGLFALLVFLFADPIYSILVPEYSYPDRAAVVSLTRILVGAQLFFVVSYVCTGILESYRRFFLPAVAPLFYNLGIIVGTIALSSKIGLFAPAAGAVAGALLHLTIQLPTTIRLGLRFRPSLDLSHPGLKSIATLAAPRVVEVSILQIVKSIELRLTSIISLASLTFYTFANSLYLVPVALFGTSIAKAALPTLTRESENRNSFERILRSSLSEVLFLTAPILAAAVVLRIPFVRIAFGTSIFTWAATVQTGYVLSAFAPAVVFQSANALLSRGFYALHDTRSPVVASIVAILTTVLLDLLFVLKLQTPVWGLALAFSLGAFIQTIILVSLLSRMRMINLVKTGVSLLKILTATLASSSVMFLLLKLLDRSAWDKKLSFLGKFGFSLPTNFEGFVLDTRYTVNLIFLTAVVLTAGIVIYLVISFMLGSEELATLWRVFLRLVRGKLPEPAFFKRKIESLFSQGTDGGS